MTKKELRENCMDAFSLYKGKYTEEEKKKMQKGLDDLFVKEESFFKDKGLDDLYFGLEKRVIGRMTL